MTEIVLGMVPPLLVSARERLDEAVVAVKAAAASAQRGDLDKAVSALMRIEPLIYEVNTLVNAASLLHRIGDA